MSRTAAATRRARCKLRHDVHEDSDLDAAFLHEVAGRVLLGVNTDAKRQLTRRYFGALGRPEGDGDHAFRAGEERKERRIDGSLRLGVTEDLEGELVDDLAGVPDTKGCRRLLPRSDGERLAF